MSLRVVGAGLGRTGTHSLKLALEQLLGAPCYHMFEVMGNPDRVSAWQTAVDGGPVDWSEMMSGYAAAVDWPVAAFWRELVDAFPDAVVLLSVREPDEWWASADRTIFELSRREPPDDPVFAEGLRMATDMLSKRFTPGWSDEETAKAAYVAHNEEVRRSAPAERLVEWAPGDGWAPICAALEIAVPDAPFPHVNTTEEFRMMLEFDSGDSGTAANRWITVAGWHLLLLEIDTDSLIALRVAIDALTEVEDVAGRDDGEASARTRARLVELDRARLAQGLLVLSHLLGTYLARSNDTTIKTVLTGLREHVELETERRG